jgi:putative ABC transport system ATP-binding protein
MNPLVVEDVTKNFRQGQEVVRALDAISLQVEPGQFLAVMGASGSGKSTLLHLVAGLTSSDGGRVLINGTELGKMTDRQLTLFRRRHVGLIFQSFNLIPTLTAHENVALPLMLEGTLTAGQKDKVRALIGRLGMGHRAEHRPDALSGGEQQRIAIGRALITEPALVLADEPTGNLDAANSRAVCELLRDLSVVHGKTIVMVTHEPAVAAYAQEVAVIKDGKLLDRFPTEGPASSQELAVRYQECLR